MSNYVDREAKRQKLEELNQQLRMLENDIQLVKQRSDVVSRQLFSLSRKDTS